MLHWLHHGVSLVTPWCFPWLHHGVFLDYTMAFPLLQYGLSLGYTMVFPSIIPWCSLGYTWCHPWLPHRVYIRIVRDMYVYYRMVLYNFTLTNKITGCTIGRFYRLCAISIPDTKWLLFVCAHTIMQGSGVVMCYYSQV